MNFLEAIYHDNLTAVSQQLEENPALLNQADAQGNTPLHYAVAQQNLPLIELLIYQGAEVTVKNQQGETAAEWYEEFVTSGSKLEGTSELKKLWQLVENNAVPVVERYLTSGCSPSIRYSRGSTLLHLAVERQRPAIVKVILEGTSPEKLDRLLKLKNSQGKTPLELAKQKLQPCTTPAAQEICAVLQQKQCTPVPSKSTLISQPLSTEWPLPINQDFKNRANELSNKLENPITVADFAALNPLRKVICQLAYITCRQALTGLSTFGKQNPLENILLQKLFGRWCADTQREFQNKLQDLVGYLDNLIQQQQVDQVIHFSDKISHAEGWHCREENRIYLNPEASETNLIALVATLIHEATHVTNQSHDFATMPRAIDGKKYVIEFTRAFQLALTGESKRLTPEEVKLFELRQLLQEGKSPDWQQHLYRWMALNNADTQILAILLLATLPEDYADFDYLQRHLFIKPEFLLAEYLTQHPSPLPLTAPCPLPQPEPQVVATHTASADRPTLAHTWPTKEYVSRFLNPFFNSFKKPEERRMTSPCSPKGAPSEASVSTTACSSLSPQVQQTMAATTSSADPSGLANTWPPATHSFVLNPITRRDGSQ